MPSESNATDVVPPGTPMAMIASGVRLSTGLVGDGVAVTVAVDDCVGVALGSWVAVRVCVGFVVWVLVGAACVLVDVGATAVAVLVGAAAVAVAVAMGCVDVATGCVAVAGACVAVATGCVAVADPCVAVAAPCVAVAMPCVCVGVRAGPGPPPAQPKSNSANGMQSASGLCRMRSMTRPPLRDLTRAPRLQPRCGVGALSKKERASCVKRQSSVAGR